MPKTSKGRLAETLIDDLAIARQHLARLQSLPVQKTHADALLHQMYSEMLTSIEGCIDRIQRELIPEPEPNRRNGGLARARNLTPERRTAIAKKAAAKRWHKPND